MQPFLVNESSIIARFAKGYKGLDADFLLAFLHTFGDEKTAFAETNAVQRLTDFSTG
jgi:hypothetical protein